MNRAERSSTAEIYIAAGLLMIAMAALVAGFWSGIIQRIHGGFVFFLLLLAVVAAVVFGTVYLLAFGWQRRPGRTAVVVATVPFVALVGVMGFVIYRLAAG